MRISGQETGAASYDLINSACEEGEIEDGEECDGSDPVGWEFEEGGVHSWVHKPILRNLGVRIRVVPADRCEGEQYPVFQAEGQASVG